MLRDRQEILAVGELAVFVAVWLLSISSAIDYYRHQQDLVPSNRVASSQGPADYTDGLK